MDCSRIKGPALLLLAAAASVFAAAPAIAPAFGAEPGVAQLQPPAPVARRLQMGVGKSVIIDLPEEAGEIFVGDPKVANAIVRSARRLYIAAIENGQTTIFAMDRQGRQIAVIEISVGRDVGELQDLLNAAMPGNDIRVKTVADLVILMGFRRPAGEAQKALDIASGFIGTSVLGAGPAIGAPAGGGTATQVSVSSAGTPLKGAVINSLTIRGVDQVSVRVTVSEIRRDIVKQLGVNLNGMGANGSSFQVSNPFAINGAISGHKRHLELEQRRRDLSGRAAGLRASGRGAGFG